MKVIIAGSRKIRLSLDEIQEIVNASGFTITEEVSGCAGGPDTYGALWAMDNGIPVKSFSADWSLGKHAGLMRNMQMANYADALIAIWDGSSKGTGHMINCMAKKDKPIFTYIMALAHD